MAPTTRLTIVDHDGLRAAVFFPRYDDYGLDVRFSWYFANVLSMVRIALKDHVRQRPPRVHPTVGTRA